MELCSSTRKYMFDYFEIFLGRMLMCRRAAEVFGTTFRLKANGQKVV